MTPVIYQLTNQANGKRYIGLTGQSVTARWNKHVSNAKKGMDTYLYRAIRKYGPDTFELATVASCLSADDATAVEQLIITQEHPEYNLTNGGEWTRGKKGAAVGAKIAASNTGKRRTPEQNAANSERAKAKHADPAYKAKAIAALGKARSSIDRETQRKAVAASAKNRIWTPESRAKLSASCTARYARRESLGAMD